MDAKDIKDKKIILLDGPRGVGKDAIIKILLERHGDKFKRITSYSTRPMRAGEVNGDTHWFIDNNTFLQKVENGEIFEYTDFHGTYRGMSKKIIDDIINSGYRAIHTVDIVGVRAIRKAFPDQSVTIFITADRDILRKRLVDLDCEDIPARLLNYDERHKYMHKSDFVVTNNNSIDECVDKILKLIHG